MAELKRYFAKYIRDSVKANYAKQDSCFICGDKENLHFHHYKTISVLVNNWLEERGLVIKTAEEAYEWRDVFSSEHEEELFEDAVTLCKAHHEKLHSIYGKSPKLVTAKKQARWVNIQREKHGLVG